MRIIHHYLILIVMSVLALPHASAAAATPAWSDGGHYRFYLHLCRIDHASWRAMSAIVNSHSTFAMADREWQPDPCLVGFFMGSDWHVLQTSLDAVPSSFNCLADSPRHRFAFQHHQDMMRIVILLGHAAMSFHHCGQSNQAYTISAVMFRILSYMANSETSFVGSLMTIRASVACLGVWYAIDGPDSADDTNVWRVAKALGRLPRADPLGVIAALEAEATNIVELSKSIADPERDLNPDLQPTDDDTVELSRRLRSDERAALQAVNGVRAVFDQIIEAAKTDDIERLRQIEAEIADGSHGPLASRLIPPIARHVNDASAYKRLINMLRALMQFDVIKRTSFSIRDIFVPRSLRPQSP